MDQQYQANNNQGLRQVNFKGGLYWARSVGIAGAHPVILAVEDGKISMKTQDNTIVFDVLISNASVRFNVFPNELMLLTVNGTKYRFSPIPGGGSKKFSPEQLAELSSHPSNNTTMAGLGTMVAGNAVNGVATTAAGQAVGTVAGGVGLGVAAAGIYAGEGSLKRWETVLANNGLVFKHKSFRGMTILLVICMIIVLITIILSTFHIGIPANH